MKFSTTTTPAASPLPPPPRVAGTAYAAFKILTGRMDVSPAIWVIAALSVVSFAVA